MTDPPAPPEVLVRPLDKLPHLQTKGAEDKSLVGESPSSRVVQTLQSMRSKQHSIFALN